MSGKTKVKHSRKLDRAVTIPFLIMLAPGALVLLINNYIPMFGTIMAFQQYRFRENFIYSIMNSEWVGFANFEFLFRNPRLWEVLRNTIGYNFVFILLGMIVPVAVAVMLNELWRPKLAKFFQTVMFLPFFLSWIVVSYLVFALLQSTGGINTMIMIPLGLEPVHWYTNVGAWPWIFVVLNLWKYTGYNSVIYLAAISGISQEYYEAAMIDGANKRQQTWYITVPLIRPVIIILSLLAVGRIFNSDFGMFYNIPMGRSTLFPVTEVLDTFIFRAMRGAAEFGMPVAASLFQSLVGFITIMLANFTVRFIDPDSSLF